MNDWVKIYASFRQIAGSAKAKVYTIESMVLEGFSNKAAIKRVNSIQSELVRQENKENA